MKAFSSVYRLEDESQVFVWASQGSGAVRIASVRSHAFVLTAESAGRGVAPFPVFARRWHFCSPGVLSLVAVAVFDVLAPASRLSRPVAADISYRL